MKHGDINNQQSPHDVHEEIAPNSDKAAYSSPALTIYGSVSRLTMGSGGSVTDGSKTQMVTQSDRITKENIVRIGDHPLGIGLYLFDYKPEYREECGHGRQFGVMAQEVEAVMPGAVLVHSDGYKRVNYAMLGISQRTQ